MAPYFFEPDIIPGVSVYELSEESRKHIVQVLRMREGEAVMLTDGKGHWFAANIKAADKKTCQVQINGSGFSEKPLRKVAVGISLLKNANRIEWFLEKATEMGVSEIIPLLCKRTERQHFRFDRLQHILISAMLQSQQLWLPILHEPIAYPEAIGRFSYSQKLIAHCETFQKSNISQLKMAQDVLILIGPEGDFTSSEITEALQHGFEPVSLGVTRLRTETAGVVAAALLVNQ
ncbi:RsmE family RNA methyltransferase [Filimonas effusa]|uniref:Ribosomal RNA small subunit methyltransferase E n=1 Tax=Filimonas effusa TaxID=2508721 RepID=A0A4Q1D406_9BACT|nr:RsmE family RNA methyltransferase [Filimonas effusa]RXK81877.1 16S rRNA (uracil(1498)-N(3))-methyltransferase [Filimonas effusa]